MLLLSPYFAVKGLRTAKYSHNLRERFGNLPPEVVARASHVEGSIWIHAVSVGEVLAAIPFGRELKQRYPARSVFVSTTTDTGQRLARERFDFADGVFYFPLDFRAAVRRAFRTIRPALVVIVETEIWPNFLREARDRNVPVVFINARISERSFRRSKAWRHVSFGFYEEVLGDATLFLAQSDADAERLDEMGAPPDRVVVTGNLKYDGEPPAVGAFVKWLAGETQAQERWPVVVAGSVVADEEEAVLAAYDIVQRQWRRALLVLAPRKPDRFDVAARIVADRGWKAVRRSTLDLDRPLDENADVLILDSIGELGGMYSIADAIFVGGSLVDAGGHNILEPAWFERPPVFGPSMENFRDMAQLFSSEGAGIQVRTGEQLGKTWVQLIRDTAVRDRMGKKAKELAEKNRGATKRSIEYVAKILQPDLFQQDRGPA
jgi:3-deoxy-D-manno-octulosonic-acid transferase